MFESDREVIRDAAERQMSHVRRYQMGEHAALSQQILNELARAKACLLDAKKRAAYDQELRAQTVEPIPGASALNDLTSVSRQDPLSNAPFEGSKAPLPSVDKKIRVKNASAPAVGRSRHSESVIIQFDRWLAEMAGDDNAAVHQTLRAVAIAIPLLLLLLAGIIVADVLRSDELVAKTDSSRSPLSADRPDDNQSSPVAPPNDKRPPTSSEKTRTMLHTSDAESNKQEPTHYRDDEGTNDVPLSTLETSEPDLVRKTIDFSDDGTDVRIAPPYDGNALGELMEDSDRDPRAVQAIAPPPVGDPEEVVAEIDPNLPKNWTHYITSFTDDGYAMIWGERTANMPHPNIWAAFYSAKHRQISKVRLKSNVPEFAIAAVGPREIAIASSEDRVEARDIIFSIFNERGQPVGEERIVNEDTAGSQIRPSIVATPSGDCLVVWQKDMRRNTRSKYWGIYGRIANKDGLKGNDLNIRANSKNNHTAYVSWLPTGQYLVSNSVRYNWKWTNTQRGVETHEFDEDGRILRSIRSCSFTKRSGSGYYDPRASRVRNGREFIFLSRRQNDGSGIGVEGRIVDARNHRLLANVFRVNQSVSGQQHSHEVAVGEDMVVTVWQGDSSDDYGSDVYGRVFDVAGRALTDEFVINAAREGHQRNPKIKFCGNAFVVTWRDETGPQPGIYLRRFPLSGFSPPRLAYRTGGHGFWIQTLKTDGKAFGNRDYVWKGVPAQFQDWRFTQTNGGERARIEITAEEDGDVYFVTASTKEAGSVDTTGWTAVEDAFFHYNDRNTTTMQVFRRRAKAGELVELPQGNWTGGILLIPPDVRFAWALRPPPTSFSVSFDEQSPAASVDGAKSATIMLASGAAIVSPAAKFGAAGFASQGKGGFEIVSDTESGEYLVNEASNDYTIEFWYRVNRLMSGKDEITPVFEVTGDGPKARRLVTQIHWVDKKMRFYWEETGLHAKPYVPEFEFPHDDWIHIAMVHRFGQARFYVNGTRVGRVNVPRDPATRFHSIRFLDLSYRMGDKITIADAYIDDLRISDGIARYSGEQFTPPVTSWSSPASKAPN